MPLVPGGLWVGFPPCFSQVLERAWQSPPQPGRSLPGMQKQQCPVSRLFSWRPSLSLEEGLSQWSVSAGWGPGSSLWQSPKAHLPAASFLTSALKDQFSIECTPMTFMFPANSRHCKHVACGLVNWLPPYTRPGSRRSIPHEENHQRWAQNSLPTTSLARGHLAYST